MNILYLKDPTSTNKHEAFDLKIKYNLRIVHTKEEILPAIAGFIPHFLLCSLRSPVSPQEVIDLLGVSDEEAPVIISIAGNDLKKIFPILETCYAPQLQEKYSQKDEVRTKEFEEQHNFVYQNSLEGILVTQPDGIILSANPAACEMLEMTEEEICRAGRAGIVDPEDTRLTRAIAQRKEFGKAHIELNFRKKSGEKFPVELTSTIYKDSKGKIKSTVIFRDITTRKAIEDQLLLSHESYKTLFYYSPIPYWIYDQDTLEILDVNEVALKNYGYTRKEFMKLTLLDLRSQEEIPDLVRHLNGASTADGGMRYGKFTHLKKDGSRLQVEVYGYGLKYNKRNCRLVACIDITEKEEATTKLELKRARLSAAQELAKVGYWELNINTKEFFLSDMMYKIWGRDKTNFTPGWSSFEDSIHVDDLQKFKQAQEASIREGKEHDVEYRIVQPSGEIRWIHERGRILSWKNDVPEIMERMVQDVTEEKVHLEKLVTSESRYKGIVLSQTNYLIRTDMLGNYTYYNDKFFADFGWIYEDQEILGSPSLSSIMEYHHQAVIDLVERCVMSPGTAFQLEIDKPNKKGGVRTTLWDFICLLDSHGQPTEIQCVGIDISSRVQAEKELKDSQLRYQLITEATSDAIWDWDLITGRFMWGKSFFTLFGHRTEEMHTLEAWEKLVHPDDSERMKEELNRAIEGTDIKWECEYRLKKKCGEYAYVVEKGTFLRDKHGKAYRLVGALQDITEKKKLEDLLEKANSLSRIGSFELDVVKEEIFWSPVAKEIHEVEEDFIPTMEEAIKFFKKGKSRKRVREVLKKAIDDGEPYNEELEIITTTGKELWVKAIGEPDIENGKCIRIKGSFQDINKIKRAELELTQAAKEKETLLESIGDAFFAVDENWIVTYWNKQAATFLDCPKEIILKKNIWSVFSDAVGTEFQHRYEATMKDRKKRRFEAFFERTSNWFDVSVYPTNEGLSIFFRDVTQRKTAEVKLKELNTSLRTNTRELITANKGLEQFSYIVSHNLRSPVANILGLSDLLKNEEYPAEVKENLFAEVFSNVERLDAVIKDLNSILQVKIDIKAKRERIDLKELVSGISSSIQNLIGEERAEILCDFQETSTITSVRSYLYSIFYNLIINSIKYRRPEVPPVLKISAETSGESIIFTFEDNGLGIDLSKKDDQIFTLYKRFHHHVEGKGMGLFMVKTQVEMLGGKIYLQSEVNKGTTFTIVLNQNQILTETENETIMPLPGS